MALQKTFDQSSTLKAVYSSPTGSHSFEHTLKSLPADISAADKTAYLSSLRASVTKLQADVNTFLTAKMEEDKATVSKESGKIDDIKEEEYYGEEVLE